MSQSELVKTICKMCNIGCGIDVKTNNGKIVGVAPMEEHLFRSKSLCAKAKGMIDWVYSKERVTNPLKKVNGEWKEISWDEALGFIADKLGIIKSEYGAKALALYTGTAFVGSQTIEVVRRFCDLYGTPNYTSGASFCFQGRTMGHSLVVSSNAPVNILPSLHGTKCMIIWGSDPPESSHLQTILINNEQQAGAKLIVVDPRMTSLAKQADIYAQIKPGTDCALALGLLNVIIQEGLYDESFVRDWTVGFDKLAEHVKQYPPERVEEITWVPADMIRDIARLYATSKPASIGPGISIDHSSNGVQAHRAQAILMAITGNLDIRGGNTYPAPLVQLSNLRIEGLISDEEGIGLEYPLFIKLIGERTATILPESILSGRPHPIKALIAQGGNPILMWPNTNKVREAFGKLDLVVVIDHFMTDTAKLAHIFLPATTFLEGKEFRWYQNAGIPAIMIGNKAIEPVGNCVADWKIWAELGKRMGYEQFFPWENTDELFDYLLAPSGITLDQFKEKPGGIIYARREQRRYLKEGFNTPSGKVEIYSELMNDYGYDALPTFTETPVNSLDLEKFPLILITGTRVKMYMHSRYRNIPILREQLPEPLIEINTNTAKASGIADNDMVTVKSPKGSIKLKARVTDDIHPRVASMQHGWSEANANILMDDAVRDPISAYPAFRSIICQVQKG